MPQQNNFPSYKFFGFIFYAKRDCVKASKSVEHADCQVKGKYMHKLIDKSVTQTWAWPLTMTDSLATGYLVTWPCPSRPS